MLTDNGAQFVDGTPTHPETEAAIEAYRATRDEPRLYLVHAFAHACEQPGIEHRRTKPRHPWTNGRVERMNRTIKAAAVRRCHYGGHDDLRRHLQLLVDADNFGRRLTTLRASQPMSSSAGPGQSSPLGSGSIRHISPRDQTSNLF